MGFVKRIVSFWAASVFLFSLSAFAQSANDIIGYYGGVQLNNQGQLEARGWACLPARSQSLQIQFRGFDQDTGQQMFFINRVANLAHETGITANCGNTGVGHRFKLDITHFHQRVFGGVSLMARAQHPDNPTLWKDIQLTHSADTTLPGLVAFVGDSMTKAGPWDTQQLGMKSYANYGIGGSGTSEWMDTNLDDVLKKQPQKLFIALGVNDLNWMHRRAFAESNRPDNLELEPYLNEVFVPQYQAIIEKALEVLSPDQIVLTTALPVDDRKVQLRQEEIRQSFIDSGQSYNPVRFSDGFLISNNKIESVNQKISQLAAQNGLTLMDTFTPVEALVQVVASQCPQGTLDENCNLYDNSAIHFKAHNNDNVPYSDKPGYVIWADLVRLILP